jgi:lipopolysaccharide transport system permease protein
VFTALFKHSIFSKARMQLIWHLAGREISERYAGSSLGTIWTIIHPIATLLVYLFVFGFVIKLQIPSSLEVTGNYALYFMSGFVCWSSLSEALSRGSGIVRQNSSLVKQIVFPVEILPLKTAMAIMFTHLLLLVFVVLYSGYVKSSFSFFPLTLIFLSFFLFVLVSGICYVLSICGVFFRDTAEIVQVFLTVGIFTVPVIYLPGSLGGLLGYIIYLNPFSHVVFCYQDVLFFGRFQHPVAWVVFPVWSLGLFTAGAIFFRSLKHGFGDAL